MAGLLVMHRLLHRTYAAKMRQCQPEMLLSIWGRGLTRVTLLQRRRVCQDLPCGARAAEGYAGSTGAIRCAIWHPLLGLDLPAIRWQHRSAVVRSLACGGSVKAGWHVSMSSTPLAESSALIIPAMHFTQSLCIVELDSCNPHKETCTIHAVPRDSV